MTYTITAAATNEKCHDCGVSGSSEEPLIALVADSIERETGYLDTVVLCDSCYRMNYANKFNDLGDYPYE